MAKRRLVIDSDEQSPFFLLIDGGSLTVGGTNEQAATVLEKLRVVRIRCELEVECDKATVRQDEPGQQPGTPRDVRFGELIQAAGARVFLERTGEGSSVTLPAAVVPTPTPPPAAETPDEQPALELRLRVIDGADQGQTFPLPESGTVTLGKDRKFAEIVLHDLYVARAHCMLEIEGGKVVVADGGSLNTLINGRKITRQEMALGDILRIGNSHLRLEVAVPGEEFAKVGGPRIEEEQKPPAVAKEADAGPESSIEIEVVEEEQEEQEPLPDGASEPVRLLHAWREKLTQLTGQSFGHYKLGSVLGMGRSGVVFRAEDTKSGQALAVKVLSPQFPQNDQELQRFARTVKSMLPLRHPHLVGLHGAGKTGAYTWIAREYVEGDSVAKVLKRLAKSRKYDVRRACRVALHVGWALNFARKNRLRHGKVNPLNILVQREDKAARLADLGLGPALEGSQLWGAVLEHRPLVELAYLSPEQATPGAFVDELSDQYGLGAVLYTLLTGQPPFTGASAEEVLEQVRGGDRPERPTRLNPSVPATLEGIVLKMLTKHQEDRYPTPAEMLAELEPVAKEVGVAI